MARDGGPGCGNERRKTAGVVGMGVSYHDELDVSQSSTKSFEAAGDERQAAARTGIDKDDAALAENGGYSRCECPYLKNAVFNLKRFRVSID
jgi:hypothetical protein